MKTYIGARKTLYASFLVRIIQEKLMIRQNRPLDRVVPLW